MVFSVNNQPARSFSVQNSSSGPNYLCRLPGETKGDHGLLVFPLQKPKCQKTSGIFHKNTAGNNHSGSICILCSDLCDNQNHFSTFTSFCPFIGPSASHTSAFHLFTQMQFQSGAKPMREHLGNTRTASTYFLVSKIKLNPETKIYFPITVGTR